MTRIGQCLFLALVGLVAGAVAVGTPATSIAQALPPACGTVMVDTTLRADCLAPLTVAADDVTVDLGGHQVLCLGGTGSTGIDVSDRRDVRIQNGQVNNCSISVLLLRGGGHTLKRLQISSGPGGGVVIDDSDENLLRHVRVTSARGFGVRVSGRNNRLEANEMAGILSQGGTAIHLLPGASDTTVLLNLVHNNAVGIQVGGSANTVEVNEANHNQIGINVDGSANTVRANVADDNGLAGITVGGTGAGNRLQANRAHGNALYDLADFPPGPCMVNRWKSNRGARLLDGCETGRR
jgi:parallel beta-helix repeat protein